MKTQAAKFVTLCSLVALGAFLMWRYDTKWSVEARREQELQSLRERNQVLETFIQRLSAEKRRADVVVTEQTVKDGQVQSTTLMFVEHATDGTRMPPRFFTIRGKVAYIDALVIQFDRHFVKEGDKLRGHSLALFYRIFSDTQAPQEGFSIDTPGQTPAVYASATGLSSKAQTFENELWQNFWRLADDSQYRAEKGVRVAMGQSVWRHFYPGHVYTVTLEAAGGLSIAENPIEGLWKEYTDAIKRPR